jgi:hypothetical protein
LLIDHPKPVNCIERWEGRPQYFFFCEIRGLSRETLPSCCCMWNPCKSTHLSLRALRLVCCVTRNRERSLTLTVVRSLEKITRCEGVFSAGPKCFRGLPWTECCAIEHLPITIEVYDQPRLIPSAVAALTKRRYRSVESFARVPPVVSQAAGGTREWSNATPQALLSDAGSILADLQLLHWI